MVSDRIYDLCRPVLEDEGLGEEEKTDQLEELLSNHGLKGKALEDAVLGCLWQSKSEKDKSSSPPPVRGATVIRSKSPAPWIQRAGTPVSVSGKSSPRPSTATPTTTTTPAYPPGLGPQRPEFARTRSSAASPFTSPRPSPRLPAATPAIPHSPRLSAYQFADSSPTTENYGEYGSDTVDWLVNDDASSTTSFSDAGGFNPTPTPTSDFISPYTMEMSPYDMLRSILQDHRTDDELEAVLEANGYDLSQTINALMEAQGVSANAMAAAVQEQQRNILIGKSMSPSSRPMTPAGQQKSPIVCRYWLASGHCARADCRFAHEVQNHVCKYWLQGNCIAGQNCLFSHDPAMLMNQLNLNPASGASTPQQQSYQPANLQLQDYESFPALQPTTSNPYEDDSSAAVDPNILNAVLASQNQNSSPFPTPSGLHLNNFLAPDPRFRSGSRPSSRPGSRHASRSATPSQQPNFADDEAFPSLGSAAAAKTSGKRHHGKRGGHGHGHHGNNNTSAAAAVAPTPSNLADVVRMAPSSPGPAAREAMRRGLRNNRSFTAGNNNNNTTTTNSSSHPRETPTPSSAAAAAAQAIPAPQHIPWLDPGRSNGVHTAYMAARHEAFRHGGLRNKFLQSAAQAWNRGDARGAKALSLRGQNENALMREKHREAAAVLYAGGGGGGGRGEGGGGGGEAELYVDLHGLHPDEAVHYLSACLREQQQQQQRQRQSAPQRRPVYAICGTGHHSKNGKDKVGKAVRAFLVEGGWAFREFSVPGDRGNVGGILGVDLGVGGRDEGEGRQPEGEREGVKGVDGGGSGVSGSGGNGVGRGEGKGGGSAKARMVREEARRGGGGGGGGGAGRMVATSAAAESEEEEGEGEGEGR